MPDDAITRIAQQKFRAASSNKSGSTPRIFVYDRNAEQRRLTQKALAMTGFDLEVVSDVSLLLNAIDPDRCGCLVTEPHLGDRNAAQFCADAPKLGLDFPVIVISDPCDPEEAVQVVQAGAFDFLVRPFSSIRLLDAVYRAIQCSQRTRVARKSRNRLDQRYASLTDRERQILLMIVEGLPNKAIAVDLSISQRTVETHRQHIMHKLGASSLAELVRIAVVLEPDALNPHALAS